MPSNFTNFIVDWFDEDGAGGAYNTTADITADVKSIPQFTDTGTGEVNSATIVVRSLKGDHNTDSSVSTAIFEEFDRIRIRCTDLAGNTYDKFFEILHIIPSQTKGEGTLLTLECMGIEYHTQQIHMIKPYYFRNTKEVSESIGQMYNRARGTEQPLLNNVGVAWNPVTSTGNNGFPSFNANNWEFGINEDSCYNRWMDLLGVIFYSHTFQC